MLSFGSTRVAVLCSRRAPALETLLDHPLRGKLYDLACVVTTEETLAGSEAARDLGVPVIEHPIRRFADDRGRRVRDMDVRREYDAATVELLREHEVDTVVLLGYLYILTEPMLAAFDGRVVNLHDSDLTVRRQDGSRRYTGLHSTRDAIIAGAPETRSTAHVANRAVDEGPILAVSDPFPVAPFVHEAVEAGAIDIVRAYSYAHREWMIRVSWGALVIRSLEVLDAGLTGTGAMAAR